MKRMPMFFSFVMFIAACMSLAYWGIQMFKPKERSVSAPAASPVFEPAVGQWGAVFGRNPTADAAPSNYQLKGVVVAPQTQDSAAIIGADGQPGRAVALGKELSPGVKLQEVHGTYIIISESGINKRVELPAASLSGAGSQIYSPPSTNHMTGSPSTETNSNQIQQMAPGSSAAPENSR
jgi:general secretion pathway protein C